MLAMYRAVILAVSVAGILAGAGAKTWKSGATTVTLLRDGILRVSGNGPMDNRSGKQWQNDSSLIIGLIIEKGVTSIADDAFYGLKAIKSVTVPDGVTYIGDHAFAECLGLVSITLPNSLTYIGEDAFYHCGELLSVTIPGNVKSIEESTFSFCMNLKTAIIQSGVKSIKSRAFYDCVNLTSITIPNSVTSIADEAFLMPFDPNRSLTSIIIPDGVKNIGSGAFYGCVGLTSVTIPSSVTSTDGSAFGRCTGMTSINVHNDNPAYASVDGVLFNKAKDTLIKYPGGKQGAYTIPGSVNTIGDDAFAFCAGLKSVEIPNSVKTIDVGAFAGSGLTAVTIPSSVKSIMSMAFEDCYHLTSVTSLNRVPPVVEKDDAFNLNGANRPITATLYVPTGSANAYRRATGWRVFKNISWK
jgi:hypothetical protein